MSESETPRPRVIAILVVVAVTAIGYALLAGGATAQLVAGGVVMLGAAALGILKGLRRPSTVSLVGALALLAGGSYGVALASAGQDPFTDNVVLGLLVLGLVIGLFDSPDEKSAEDADADDAAEE
ncbi:hypothetical protein BRC81_08455 [Halobacteriales archaeon QS_1_68_20]|nr:MAG: hypothetical protein BRC81_08455 [Halobacteriales archaeon QS_1_68_20]